MAVDSASGAEGGVARVVPLLGVRSLGGRSFDYLVPGVLSKRVKVGAVVGVQFGRRHIRAVVVDVTSERSEPARALRHIESVEEIGVTPGLLDLSRRLAVRYIAPLGTCLRLVAPPVPSTSATGQSGEREKWVFAVDAGGSGGDIAISAPLPPKQKRLLSRIPHGGVSAAAACREAEVSRSVLRALVGKGMVKLAAPPYGIAASEVTGRYSERSSWPELSDEQRSAVDRLSGYLQGRKTTHRLLWGVTGSGKTEVYLRLIDQVVAEGGSVILLVPEIALTAMMVQRVRERFGELVGVVHSGLSLGRRRHHHQRIAAGEARVVIGARSAVFAPVQNLRLVIIDECHDTSYKQEEAPGYHAKTVAQMRLEDNGGLLLEGSASPPVEATSGRSGWIRMAERVRGALPSVEAVDMRHESGGSVLAGVTRHALAQVVRKGEQAIVLLNRRGYSGHVHCESCGHVMMCDDCELALTYHDRSKSLLCHHCGRSYVQPGLCPDCDEAPLVRGVPGTERVAEELERVAPSNKVFRLDSDVITSASRAKRILQDFAASKPSLLVGTQMVAKGHDFPDVTLVVVADADTGLYVPDFRAAERTFQLLTQVAGRAGRADIPGRVVVQTWNPDVPCIRMALDRAEEAFYLREAAIRERLGYPPFTELVRLVMVGGRLQQVRMAAEHLVDRLRPHLAPGEVRGPARLVTLRGKSRWHVVLSCKDGERARAIAAEAVSQLGGPYGNRGVSLVVDVDPYTFV